VIVQNGAAIVPGPLGEQLALALFTKNSAARADGTDTAVMVNNTRAPAVSSAGAWWGVVLVMCISLLRSGCVVTASSAAESWAALACRTRGTSPELVQGIRLSTRVHVAVRESFRPSLGVICSIDPMVAGHATP
jgi:hypothetical protein